MPAERPARSPGRRAARIGYARVSTDEQDLALQRDALRAAGCARVFCDEGVSGAEPDRPALKAALRALRPGDVLVTWRLDRLGRSLAHLIELIGQLEKRGVGFHSLSEAIDTTTAGGRLIFHVMGALAEFERALIGERTRAGMAAARARGRRLGRPPKLTAAKAAAIVAAVSSGQPVDAVARRFRVSPSTVPRAVKAHG